MHQEGVCHRDLKPENIVIDQDGHVKICDFGEANFFDKEAIQELSFYCHEVFGE